MESIVLNPFEALGFIVSIVVGIWGIIKYLLGVVEANNVANDAKFEKERTERQNAEKELRDNIDRIKESHVRRDDFQAVINDMKNQFVGFTNSVNTRLDKLVDMVANVYIRTGGGDQGGPKA